MKRVAQIGAWALAVPILFWVAYEAMGIEIGAGALFTLFVVAFAAGFVIDFLDRRTTDARVASGVAAAGVTVMVWAGVETTGLKIENGVYIATFVSTFVVHWLWLRRRSR